MLKPKANQKLEIFFKDSKTTLQKEQIFYKEVLLLMDSTYNNLWTKIDGLKEKSFSIKNF
jgi:hypothetical protein